MNYRQQKYRKESNQPSLFSKLKIDFSEQRGQSQACMNYAES